MKTVSDILKFTQNLKDLKDDKIKQCLENISETEKQIEDINKIIDIAEIEVDVKKFTDGKFELQKLEATHELYSNQLERLKDEKTLDSKKAEEIFNDFREKLKNEDSKINKEALSHIEALRNLASKSNSLFKDQDVVRYTLEELSGKEISNSYHNYDRIGILYNKIKESKLAEEAGQKKEVDPVLRFFNKRG